MTRWYVSWSNFRCCCSLSKVVVLSRITTTNRSTVLLLVPTAYLTLGKRPRNAKRENVSIFSFSFQVGTSLHALCLVDALHCCRYMCSACPRVMDASMHVTRAVDILCYLDQQPELNVVCFSGRKGKTVRGKARMRIERENACRCRNNVSEGERAGSFTSPKRVVCL